MVRVKSTVDALYSHRALTNTVDVDSPAFLLFPSSKTKLIIYSQDVLVANPGRLTTATLLVAHAAESSVFTPTKPAPVFTANCDEPQYTGPRLRRAVQGSLTCDELDSSPPVPLTPAASDGRWKRHRCRDKRFSLPVAS